MTKATLDMRTQKRAVTDQFTSMAQRMESSQWFTDTERVKALREFAEVGNKSRVLDVGAGLGHVVLGFAPNVKFAVGVDLTREMIIRANHSKHDASVANAFLTLGDVDHLPFTRESFDVVIARAALHHFPRPVVALLEMRRTCVNAGRLIIEDTLSSENPEKSSRHNDIERLRDPTHVKMYGCGEMHALAREAGLIEAKRVEMQSERDFEEWMDLAAPPQPKRDAAKRMMLQSIREDRTGLNPRIERGRLNFVYRRVMLSFTKR